MNFSVGRTRITLLALVTVLVCVTVHEGGHALAGIVTGGHVTRVEILSATPRVQISGETGPAANMIRAVAGSGAVLAFCAAILLLVRARRSIVVQTISFFSFIELLGWMLSAAVHSFSPQPNDAGRFLRSSHMAPGAVAAVCMLLLAIGWWLYRMPQPRLSRQGVPEGSRRMSAVSSA